MEERESYVTHEMVITFERYETNKHNILVTFVTHEMVITFVTMFC